MPLPAIKNQKFVHFFFHSSITHLGHPAFSSSSSFRSNRFRQFVTSITLIQQRRNLPPLHYSGPQTPKQLLNISRSQRLRDPHLLSLPHLVPNLSVVPPSRINRLSPRACLTFCF